MRRGSTSDPRSGWPRRDDLARRGRRARALVSPALAVLVVLGTTAFLFWPLASGALGGSPRWFEWDVPEQYWPDLVFLCESLHEGELPYWNPYDRAGYPIHADPQAALYHPMSWAICGLAGPSPALGWATARVVLGFALAGLFALAWLRRLGASWGAAALGAAILQAAPFMRHNWELNLTLGLAHLPLVLWAADRAVVERRARDGAWLALALGLTGWAGSPPALFFVVSYALLYVVFRATELVRREGKSAGRGVGASLAIAAVLAGALLAVVIVPGLELSHHSVQAGRSYGSIAESSLEPSDLVALVWPMPGNHLYVGVLALGLAVVALARGTGALRWFFAGTFALGVLMALGDHGPLFRVAYEIAPGVSLFRAPHRYEAWLGPSAAALAAFGFTTLEARIRAAFDAPRRREIAAWCFVATLSALGLADLGRALPEERHLRDGSGPPSIARAAEVLAHAPGTADAYRYMDEFAIACRSGTRHRRRDLRGYQDPLLLRSFERVIGSVRAHPELLPQFNVRYALQGPHFIHGWNRHYLPPPAELAVVDGARTIWRGSGERSVTELPTALPLAYFVPAAHVEHADGRANALLRTAELAPAPLAILDGASDPEDATLPAGGTATRATPLVTADLERFDTGTVRVSVEAPTRGVVVVNETFYPGWRATVDGEPASIFRANALVRAVPVSAGRHTVELVYAPATARALRWLALAALLAALALVAVRGRTAR